jgi:hypothetical protein
MKLDRWTWMGCVGVALLFASGCGADRDLSAMHVTSAGLFGARITVPTGAQLHVRLASSLSSKTASAGDAWTGTLTRPLVESGREILPAGSTVEGTVVSAAPAQRGSRAQIELGVRAVRVEDRKIRLCAEAEPVVAGSTRARNIGAIAGGAAAGALLGKAISGDGSDAAKGAILGGALAAGAVAASRGYQVELKDGSTMTFLVSKDVAVSVD